MAERTLLLASTSSYRAELLRRLGLDFRCAAPHCDETAQPGESPQALARRLSYEKAASLAAQHPQALIIGSDQVADCAGQRLSKPLNYARAYTQLITSSGRQAVFYTGVCLLDAASGRYSVDCVATQVKFRQLCPVQIDRYLRTERPYRCAGSFRCEGLGISLLAQIQSDDPSALIGLPLIALTTRLNEMGVAVP